MSEIPELSPESPTSPERPPVRPNALERTSIPHRITSPKKTLERPDTPESPSSGLECPVCLQQCVHPVQLDCQHIFCYLCVKGVTIQSKRCPMCRREIHTSFLFNPVLIQEENEKTEEKEAKVETVFAWFYEGRNGWWRYDDRTARDLEKAYTDGEKNCEMLIAGYLYIIDIENMIQFRRNEPNRRRRMKREEDGRRVSNVKGVAGIRAPKREEEEPQDQARSLSTSDSSDVERLGTQLLVDLSLEDEDDGVPASLPLPQLNKR